MGWLHTYLQVTLKLLIEIIDIYHNIRSPVVYPLRNTSQKEACALTSYIERSMGQETSIGQETCFLTTVRMYAAGDYARTIYGHCSVHNRTLRLKREKLSFGWG